MGAPGIGIYRSVQNKDMIDTSQFMPKKLLYRYDRGIWTKHSKPYVILLTFEVIGETDKSYRIGSHRGGCISKTAKKRFAYPTPEEAMNNFILRTKRCIGFTADNLYKAEAYLKAAESQNIRDYGSRSLTTKA